MQMYNLLEHEDNYFITSGSLQNYYRDEVNDAANKNDPAGDKINNNKTTTSKYFEHKKKLIESTSNNNSRLNTEIVVPLKYLSNFWRCLDLHLIKCEIELDLTWPKNCVISETSRTPEVAGDNPVNTTLTTGATFTINNTKLYVPIVILSINDSIKFLEYVKQGFKRKTSWSKYRSEIKTQPKNDNLDYLINTAFKNTVRLFVFLFKNCNDDPTRISFHEYYIPLVEIKDSNSLIENKPFF